MKKTYLAIEINKEIFLHNIYNLGEPIDQEVPYKIIGRVCTEECDTTCFHYRKGTCPCQVMKDVEGNFIHVFVNLE